SENGISHSWRSFEALAQRILRATVPLTILRPTMVVGSPPLPSRRLAARLTVTLPGHNPTLQLLSMEDLAQAVFCACAIQVDKPGIYNGAPDDGARINTMVRLAGGHRIPVPRTLQRLASPAEALDYLRYSWTINNRRIKGELGFTPRKST